MTITNTSQTVLDRLQSGNPELFRRLYAEPIRAMAFKCASCAGVHTQDYEEIAQTVTLVVLKRVPETYSTYDRLRARFKSWLKGIVFHVTHEEVRRWRRQARSFETTNELDLMLDERDPDTDQEFLHVQLCEAIALLDEQHQAAAECLRLKITSGLTWEQLARSQGKSAAALRQQASRVCKELRAMLSQNEAVLCLLRAEDESDGAERTPQ